MRIVGLDDPSHGLLAYRSSLLDCNHRWAHRSFNIANKFQSELDKKISDYKVFLDGMIETSEAVGEAGENVKPVLIE
jgi:hypothetical protein